jgi:sec-independent protein translocase protein TatA
MINLFIGSIGGSEVLLIAFIALLLFGGKKIPELMRGLGKGIREFNDAKEKVRESISEGMRETESVTKNIEKEAKEATDSK